MDKKNTVLITGARAPIALELSRSFAAKGHKVIMADSQKFPISRWSKTIHKYIQYPPPAQNTDAFIRVIADIIKNEKVDQLIPTCEEAFYISQNSSFFRCNVWSPSFPLMNTLHNKALFIEIAAHYFPVPKTVLIPDFKDWHNSQQYVFKKKYCRFANFVLIGEKEEKCKSVKDNPTEWIAQELIKGKEVCVYSIWDNGTMKAFSCYHPFIRLGKGAGVYFEPVESTDIFTRVKAFGESIQYHGQLCFDIIIKNNKPYIIECNPRGTSGAHLLNKSLCDAFLGEKLIQVSDKQEYYVLIGMLLTKPIDLFRKKTRKAKEVVFSRKDVLPFLLLPISFLEILLLKWSIKLTLQEATTVDIEWNGTINKIELNK
jgi:hypothetical protein